MRNNFKQMKSEASLPVADAVARKNAALKAALAYIEAQGRIGRTAASGRRWKYLRNRKTATTTISACWTETI